MLMSMARADAGRSNTFYAIRRRVDGAFLPALNSYGFTRSEPSLVDPPRLFKEKRNATQALQWWLKGESFESSSYSDEDFSGSRTIEIKTLHRPGRRGSDFEIVVVGLLVRTLEQAELDKL